MYSLNLFAEQCMDIIGRSYMFVTFGSWRVTAKWKHADEAKHAVQLQPIWEKQVHEHASTLFDLADWVGISASKLIFSFLLS